MFRKATSTQPIKVLVVDDSAFIRMAIKKMLEADPEIKVVGTASNGLNAIEQIKAIQPDIVTMDIEMPQMDGLTALKKIMAETPLPVLMISTLTESGASATIEALSLGALDYIPKRLAQSSLDILRIQDELHAKVKALARRRPRRASSPQIAVSKPLPAPKYPSTFVAASDIRVVAIGTSTGGPKALQEIIPLLPANFPVGILVVQHMPPFFTKSLAGRLDSLSQLSVKEAEAQDVVAPGKVLIAPGGQHMTVCKRGSQYMVRLSESPTDLYHIPSVDVMMSSVAEAYGRHAIGVILTGMGHDGSEGMAEIHRQNGITLAQDEATSVIYGMPKVCVERGFVNQVLPLDRMAATLIRLVQKKTGTSPLMSHFQK